MHQSNPRRARLLAITQLTVFALFAAACGNDDTSASGGTTDTSAADDTAAASDSASASGELEGSFLVSGSSTVYPIVLEQAEAFGAANGGVAISVEGPGSGDGAQKFCNGEVPIARFLYVNADAAAGADAESSQLTLTADGGADIHRILSMTTAPAYARGRSS